MPEKAEVFSAVGGYRPVVDSERSFVDVVREVIDVEGFSVVYEANGTDSFRDLLDCVYGMRVCANMDMFPGRPIPWT